MAALTIAKVHRTSHEGGRSLTTQVCDRVKELNNLTVIRMKRIVHYFYVIIYDLIKNSVLVI